VYFKSFCLRCMREYDMTPVVTRILRSAEFLVTNSGAALVCCVQSFTSEQHGTAFDSVVFSMRSKPLPSRSEASLELVHCKQEDPVH